MANVLRRYRGKICDDCYFLISGEGIFHPLSSIPSSFVSRSGNTYIMRIKDSTGAIDFDTS